MDFCTSKVNIHSFFHRVVEKGVGLGGKNARWRGYRKGNGVIGGGKRVGLGGKNAWWRGIAENNG